MTKKEVLQHIIDIFYEQLLISQINLQYIEDQAKELGGEETFDYQASKGRLMQEINGKSKQIEIAKKMLKDE